MTRPLSHPANIKRAQQMTFFTHKQLKIFQLLLEHGAVHVATLSEVVNSAPPSLANNIAVHISGIRRKIKKHKLPYTIKNRHGFGTYELIQHDV